MAANRKILSPEQAQARLEALCARAEHCEGELRQKMAGWGIALGDQEKVLQRLREAKFVDDSRFASAYVRDKARFAKWGTRKIRQGLMLKKVPREIIDSAISVIDRDEYVSGLLSLLQSKINAKPELIGTFEGRTKLFRFAVSRGFETDIASVAVKSLFASRKQ